MEHFSNKQTIRLILNACVVIYLSISIVSPTQAQPVKWKNNKYLTVVSYNAENLFDTINNPHKNDNEFTPDSKKRYNTKRYYKKLNNLAKVISSINANELPEIIGLTEVENKSVLLDLIKTTNLQSAKYKVILEEGPDPRGIDCGLIYRPDVFKYISHKTLEVRFPFSNNRRTRDILYVKGLIKKDTLHLFVNHWSSRRGGQEKSEPKRMQSAKVLKQNIDSILLIDAQANIVIMGDFNDEPSNKSINEVLGAKKIAEPAKLKNLMYALHKQGKGSYYYKGNYNMLDNLIVTSNLTTNTKGFRLFENRGWIFMPEFICYTFKNGDKSPAKTYGGSKYYGGYSDHFPVYTIFYEK